MLVAQGSGDCDAGCERRLYATRQARTMQGKEQERIVRVFLRTGDAAPSAALLAQHPGLVVARVPDAVAAQVPGGAGSLYLIDPLGNLVLALSRRSGHQGHRPGLDAPSQGVAHRVSVVRRSAGW